MEATELTLEEAKLANKIKHMANFLHEENVCINEDDQVEHSFNTKSWNELINGKV